MFSTSTKSSNHKLIQHIPSQQNGELWFWTLFLQNPLASIAYHYYQREGSTSALVVWMPYMFSSYWVLLISMTCKPHWMQENRWLQVASWLTKAHHGGDMTSHIIGFYSHTAKCIIMILVASLSRWHIHSCISKRQNKHSWQMKNSSFSHKTCKQKKRKQSTRMNIIPNWKETQYLQHAI